MAGTRTLVDPVLALADLPEPETGAPPEAPVPAPEGAAPPVELLVAVEDVFELLEAALDDEGVELAVEELKALTGAVELVERFEPPHPATSRRMTARARKPIRRLTFPA